MATPPGNIASSEILAWTWSVERTPSSPTAPFNSGFQPVIPVKSTDPGDKSATAATVVHIATTAGPLLSVPDDVVYTCRMLSSLGWRVTMLTVAGSPCRDQTEYRTETFANVLAGVPLLAKLDVAPAMSRYLRDALRETDIVHAHGLWRFPNVYAANEARRARKPYIVAPRGMLAPEALRFGALQKRLMWWAHQKRVLARATCLQASSEGEYRDIRALGMKTPVAIIPLNFGTFPAIQASRPVNGSRIVLSLGRLHPIKGLDVLIAAWARIEKKHPGWRLQIAGPSEGAYESVLRGLAAASGAERIDFLGPRIGPAKAETFAGASLFALPSHSESFAVTVPEALSYGVPVIASEGAPWAALRENGCGWWIGRGVEALAAGLVHAMSLSPDELRHMGERGRDWVAREFSSEAVTRRLDAIYRWMRRDADAPSDLRFL
jgi:glycosyltransferase involved in cell wall biosynthesis